MNHEFIHESEGPDFDNLISSMICDGIRVTAIGVSGDAITSKTEPYDLIEMPDGLSAIVAISKDYIEGLIENCPTPFTQGFTFGMFINQVLSESMSKMMEGAND